jgi:hypothetical protein
MVRRGDELLFVWSESADGGEHAGHVQTKGAVAQLR